MKDNLPFFKYHPNPLVTGNAIEKDFVCLCCNQEKKVAYLGGIHSSTYEIEREMVCLECISDGSASNKWDASFGGLMQDREKISKEIIDELEKRTPDYSSWQDSVWLTHCDDSVNFMEILLNKN